VLPVFIHECLYLFVLVPVFGREAWYFGIHFMGNVTRNSDKQPMMSLVLLHAFPAALFHNTYLSKDGTLLKKCSTKITQKYNNYWCGPPPLPPPFLDSKFFPVQKNTIWLRDARLTSKWEWGNMPIVWQMQITPSRKLSRKDVEKLNLDYVPASKASWLSLRRSFWETKDSFICVEQSLPE